MAPKGGCFQSHIAPYWRSLVLVVLPLLLLPLPVVSATSAARCGYVILIMAAYWMTEALPLAITALIPVFAFPLLGILSTGECCLVYMKETNMMFLGGLTVAIAVEHCNLHKRIALFVILHVGQSPRRLMAGFMLTTMFLSMWISNTASTAMMVPIVDAILVELYATRSKKQEENATAIDMSVTSGQNQLELSPAGENGVSDGHNKKERAEAGGGGGTTTEVVTTKSTSLTATPPDEECRALRDMCFLATAYAANIGGTGSLTGTGPNLVVKGVLASAIDTNNHEVEKEDKITDEEIDAANAEVFRQRHIMRRALLLGVAYSANVGGTGVVTGTSPNLVLMAVLQDSFSEPTGLNFATWMAFNVPGMILCVILAWIWLQVLFMGLFRKQSPIQQSTPERTAAVRRLIRQKYKELGPMTHHEATVLTLFIILVLLWLFRAPEFVPGWSAWFKDAFEGVEVDDATPAMLIVTLLFILPARLNFWCFRNPKDPEPPQPSPACMNWQVVHEKIPWGVVLLLGGGFAMAEGANKSGLSAWLGDQLVAFDVMPKEAIVFVVSLMTAMLTEVASNTATASILLPVLKEMALNISVNPLYLMLPAAVCCSYAFMLPVATPPNAIVFSAANMKSADMMKAGFIMNIICVVVITVMINTLGVALFDLQHMPPWANSTINALN
ncbi:Na(+)/citrate cotransporter-like isoform X9 [Macrobrachium rosenbergii]|uniref:Na(+)/citrate cotransporter-like isoform X9 n=1 Tax=Macrobrachium rosenbergii TaxID=79674 RepID=UPI0034D3C2D7